MRKLAVSLVDSQDLRIIINVLYTILEVIRVEQISESSEYKTQVESFVFEIGILTIKTKTLLYNLTIFCS